MARPRTRSSRGGRTSRTRARGRGGRATGGGSIARYVIPVAAAGALLWYLMPTAQAGGPGGKGGEGGEGGEGAGTVPDEPVPFAQYTANDIPRERITAQRAGNILSAPNRNSTIVGRFAAGERLITPNVDDTRNFGGPLRQGDPGQGTPGYTDPGWFPVEVAGRPAGGWARLILFDFASREPVLRIGEGLRGVGVGGWRRP